MSSAWEFLKRNRGKLALVGVVSGGVYLGKKFYDRFYFYNQLYGREFFQNGVGLSSMTGLDDILLSDEKDDESDVPSIDRKLYIFNSNQKTCDASVKELAASLKAVIDKRYDVEALLQQLQDGACPNKIEVWNKIKILSFTRLVVAMHSVSVLILTLKIQISLVAGDIYDRFVKKHQKSNAASDLLSVLRKTFDNKSNDDLNSLDNAHTQQIFLQSLQYFMKQGSEYLAKHVERHCNYALHRVSLKHPFTSPDLTHLFTRVCARIQSDPVFKHLSNFVTPGDFSDNLNESKLCKLLQSLKISLNSRQCSRLFADLVDDFVQRFVLNFTHSNIAEWRQRRRSFATPPNNVANALFDATCNAINEEHDKATIKPEIVNFACEDDDWASSFLNGTTDAIDGYNRNVDTLANEIDEEQRLDDYAQVPLAKLLPIFTDAFHFLFKTSDKSPIDLALKSCQLEVFCLDIFENYGK